MSVDAGSNAADDVVSNVSSASKSFSSEFSNVSDFFLCQFSLINVVHSLDVVSLNVGRENWESMLGIHIVVKLRNENTSDFNLISRSS